MSLADRPQVRVFERPSREDVLVLVRVMLGGLEAFDWTGVTVPLCGTDGMGVFDSEEDDADSDRVDDLIARRNLSLRGIVTFSSDSQYSVRKFARWMLELPIEADVL